MGCKYKVMDKCKVKKNKDAFCFGKDGCPNYEDENVIKATDKYRCIYCGTEIDWGDSNNPFDEGLHNIPDKYSNSPSVCCKYCNSITFINRNFKRLIEEPQDFDLWVYYLKDEINELESDRDKIIEHYLNAKRNKRPTTYSEAT